ncbi:hypothetical protein KKE26_03985 [bacterium]|nr:hypothetical protein [bacterium]
MMTTNLLDALPDFSNFEYQVAIAPAGSQLDASWSKLRECERRLEMYRWFEKQNDPAKAQHRFLIYDSVSAFLLTFEATLQILQSQLTNLSTTISGKNNFGNWLCKQPQYDVIFRGLRSLRHLEAHVEPVQKPSEIKAVFPSSSVSRTYKLPRLDRVILGKLKHSPLKNADMGNWNNLVANRNVTDIFTEGLQKLKEILEAVETLI